VLPGEQGRVPRLWLLGSLVEAVVDSDVAEIRFCSNVNSYLCKIV